MLVKPTMEKLLKKVSSRYILTILAAKRARQLVNGAQPLAESDTPNYVTNACEEIAAGKVVPVRGIVNVTVPLRPEVEAERLREEMEKRNARYREEMEEESNARMRSLMAISNSDEEDEIPDPDADPADTEPDDTEQKAKAEDDDEDDLLSLENLITFLDNNDTVESLDGDDLTEDITDETRKESSDAE